MPLGVEVKGFPLQMSGKCRFSNQDIKETKAFTIEILRIYRFATSNQSIREGGGEGGSVSEAGAGDCNGKQRQTHKYQGNFRGAEFIYG